MSSYYEALPIYKAAMDVAARIDSVVQRFGKAHKYTLGGRLRETSVDVILCPGGHASGRIGLAPAYAQGASVHRGLFQDQSGHRHDGVSLDAY